jgi:hypothetical protein
MVGVRVRIMGRVRVGVRVVAIQERVLIKPG